MYNKIIEAFANYLVDDEDFKSEMLKASKEDEKRNIVEKWLDNWIDWDVIKDVESQATAKIEAEVKENGGYE